MNTQPIKSTFIVRAAVTLLLTVLTTTSAWAQTIVVSDEVQLNRALSGGNGVYIRLANDILLNSYLNINGRERVTIDLNGHKLYRSLGSHNSAGHVIYSAATYDLTLISSVPGGSIEGGKANNGGAIYIQKGSKVTATDVTFQNNSAADHAGAIWNNGTFEATNCTFKNNSAKDVGAIYNSVTSDGAGVATLKDCTFTGNVGTAGAGALANALGNTVMTIDGGTIKGNAADTYGAGIWNGGTLNMKGAITVQDNKNVGGVVSNVYLKNGKVITVTGSLEGSKIGMELESTSGTFTSGYGNYQHGYRSHFTADRSSIVGVGHSGGEACLTAMLPGSVYYYERSWDDTNKKVVNTEKYVSELIAYDATPKGTLQYKEVTNAPASSPNEWFGLGGYGSGPEYYLVRGNVNRQTIVVQGKDVHLILLNGATLTLTGGLRLEGDNKLYIHSQSFGGAMGRLMVTNQYDDAAGIGSARHDGKVVKAGELVIHGGHIEVTGGKYGAGIGSCDARSNGERELCNSITVYGGYVNATGGIYGAGIGGGYQAYGALFVLYDGTVLAQGGGSASGVGGGEYGDGGNLIVYGGSLTATGSGGGAGIGSGSYNSSNTPNENNNKRLCGGKFTIFGGTVTATGYKGGAGIGGGRIGSGAEVKIHGGTVTATGDKEDGAGIGGGIYGIGGNVTISSGTVTATGGKGAAGIGGGYKGDGGNVTITGGNVIACTKIQKEENSVAIGPGACHNEHGTLSIGNTMMVGAGDNGSVERMYNADERVNGCWYHTYANISPCTHSNAAYTVSDVTHTLHCNHCTTTFAAEPHDFDENNECSVCHFKGTSYTVTIYLPDAEEDDTYTTDGAYKSYTYDMVSGTSFTLPGAPQDLQNMEFAGWLVTTEEGTPSFSSYRASADEILQAVGTPYTLTGNVSIIARYKDIAISLDDDGDNYETIFNYGGKKAVSVTLNRRTLYKDGKWNTLCLPFAVTDGDETDGVSFSGTPLEGATVLTLDEATLGDGTLTFNFEEVTAMEPGKPYLIKWANDSEHPTIVNPVFHGVTISNTSTDEKAVDSGIVYFKGHYAPLSIGKEGDLPVLYLGSDNTFRYPDDAMNINAFRACFYSNADLGDVNDDGDVNVTDVSMLVNHILGAEDENFNINNADVTRDGSVTITDVTALVNLILNGNSVLKIVVNGADGITFGGGGTGVARLKILFN